MDSDAFNKREKANEDYYVRQKEREKSVESTPLSTKPSSRSSAGLQSLATQVPWSEGSLLQSCLLMILVLSRLVALKEKLRQQRQHLDELEQHMYAVPIPDS